MRSYELSDNLKKILVKLRKNKTRYEAILKKIEEILNCEDINHYKNLRKPLQHLKRVHIDKSFVLTFRQDKNVVIFYDFDHHDNIYKK